AAYHFVIERFPDLQVGECNLCIPCTVAWFRKFGIVTIPFMAFVSFAVIITVLMLDRTAAPSGDGSPANGQ
ncbi:MAG TPA: disulfide bond formation protein B, partial [Acidimicrobiia bacterium]|nr:disulfide bond formation protein B [Acidimicrobiia bacterium]